jgi:hypothetical protein
MKNSLFEQKPILAQAYNNKPSKSARNSLHFSFLTIGVITGFVILGLVTTSYVGVHQGIQDEAQATNSNNILARTVDTFPVQSRKSYNNVLLMEVVNLLQ